jgi:hypothetical protein
VVGNEDPLEKKAKDQDILDIALPEQSHFLCTREPMFNYADPELCGKWKVSSTNSMTTNFLGTRQVVTALVSRGK